MPNPKKPDLVLTIIIAALISVGVLILASVSSSYSQEKFGSPYSVINHQLIFGLFPGLILGFIAYFFSLEKLKKWALPLLILNIVLLTLVFLPIIGISLGGANRWINLGFITLQPSEFLKITFILYLAAWISKAGNNSIKRNEKIERKLKKDKYPFLEFFLPFVGILIMIGALLMLQRDMTTLCIITAIALTMYFIASTPIWQTVSLIALLGTAIGLLVKFEPYRMNRISVFLNPALDPMGFGYQIKQALIAVGSGGIIGVGLGMSGQKLGFLPQSIGDSIFAIFAEEGGLIGGIILIALFAMFVWKGFALAKRSSDKFLKLIAFGITFWIGIQAFINIGSIISFLPLSGVPLPFVSAGGSALINEIFAMGILLNISRQKQLNS